MERRIKLLVPVDASDASKPAIDLALNLAETLDAHLCFCHSVDLRSTYAACASPSFVSDPTPVVEMLESESAAVLAAAADSARAADAAVETVELAGSPVEAIVDLAEDRRVDAIVIGTHARKGADRFFLGSVTEGVLRRANVPVFVASSGGIPDAIHRIGVAFDDSEPAAAALDFAIALATRLRASLVVINAVDPTIAFDETERNNGKKLLHRATSKARKHGLVAEALLVDADPVTATLGAIRSEKFDVLAIGTHGRRGVSRFVLGSVAERIIRESPAPVVALRHAADPSFVTALEPERTLTIA